MWLGVDDTDGPESGCTTYTLTEILRTARGLGVDLIGAPSLVRLNPNIPWKTRGNAALSARFGRGRGSPKRLGELPEGPLLAHPRGDPLPPTTGERFLEAAWRTVLATSDRGPRADPVMVASERRPDESLYWRAVRSVVPVGAARAELDRVGGRAFQRGSSRGLVGAVAAIAWPGRRRTYELLAYRSSPSRRRREVDAESVRTAQARFPSLFLCDDPETRRLLVAPHTACPILFGLRGTNAAALPPALGLVRSEPRERWVLFRTNQATGDHLTDRTIAEVRPYEPGRLSGRITGPPERGRGGHVRFRLTDAAGGTADCIVFEPTKQLASVAAALAGGDEVRIWGGRGQDPSFRVEGIEIQRAPLRLVGVRPPRCLECGRSANSLGTGRGYRCSGCHRRFPPEAGSARFESPLFGPGVYHPTPSARRHLHPLFRDPRPISPRAGETVSPPGSKRR